MNGHRNSRAQSAMEYLMTYGWAILIIAVVLAALFSLNVFNAGAQLGTSCIGQPGFSCSNPAIAQTGVLQFTFGQGLGYETYNAYLACVSTSNSVSANALSYTSVSLVGGPNSDVASGSQFTVSGLQCYSSTGAASLSPIGTSFTGVLWLKYATTQSGAVANQYQKLATISVKSSS